MGGIMNKFQNNEQNLEYRTKFRITIKGKNRNSKGQRFGRLGFHAPDDPTYCVPGPILHLCFLCGSMCSSVGLCVPNIFVESTKLQCGATPPSLMVLLLLKFGF